MKVVSINVSLPKEIEWKGRTVSTSIFKRPVDGRVVVRRLNLDGDAQADLQAHGGEHRAVFVYQVDSYRYWRERLGRDDLHYGQFGENLTVEGLADDEVCIGDRYQIGTAVFEVTQPRVTCYRLGIALGVPEMPALVVSERRPGFYFRVIREGDVCAGDEITKIADGPEGMHVADIDQLLYSNNHPKELLIRALKIPALSKGWQGSFQELLDAKLAGVGGGNAGLTGDASRPLAWPGFRRFLVKRIRQESPGVRSFELSPADDRPIAPFVPGQHIAVKLPASAIGSLQNAPANPPNLTSPPLIAPANLSNPPAPLPNPPAKLSNPTAPPDAPAPPLIRMYSLCGPEGASTYRIAVKRETDGPGSAYMHERLREGDTLEISAPRGTFTLMSRDTPVVLLSAGVGVTPLLAMLYALKQTSPRRTIWWIHSTRNGASYSFAGEVKAIAAGLPAFHGVSIYSRPADGEQPGVDYDLRGHLSLEVLRALNVPANGDFYLCGPGAYLRDTIAALQSLGVPADRVRFEVFGAEVVAAGGQAAPGDKSGASENFIGGIKVVAGDKKAPHLPLGTPGTGPLVTFTKSKLSFPWNPEWGSLLAAAEACDVEVRWSCRTGVCHRCESALLDGKVNYSPAPLDPPAEGNVLICCAAPQTAVQLDL
jgi:ferredoxin-NADP reductase/MOSC domain-containing protein YiiM/ferredoxin